MSASWKAELGEASSEAPESRQQTGGKGGGVLCRGDEGREVALNQEQSVGGGQRWTLGNQHLINTVTVAVKGAKLDVTHAM